MDAFDINSLTIDEAELIEDMAGRELGDILQNLGSGKFSAKTIRGIALVLARRENPEATAEDVGKVTVIDSLNRLTDDTDGE